MGPWVRVIPEAVVSLSSFAVARRRTAKSVRSGDGTALTGQTTLRHNVAVPSPAPADPPPAHAMGPARVIVLAGPSGVGKSRLSAHAGLPILRLDDFYRSGDDPRLPRIEHGSNAGLVDWDDPRSWQHDEAVRAICALATTGRVVAPVYDIARNGPSGSHLVELDDRRLFLAEGIFAQEVVADCRTAGVLAAALCLRQHPLVTFWRRLARDLRERRKPPLVLVRRGWSLMRDQRRMIAAAAAGGCEVVSVAEAGERIDGLAGAR
jgi:uridine kinase